MGQVLKREFLLLAVVAVALLLASGVALGQTAPPAPDGQEVAAEKVDAHAHHHGVVKAPVALSKRPAEPLGKNRRTRRQSPPTPRLRSTPSTRST